jgi:hypothetical protein
MNMPVFRTEKVSDYAVIAKHHLKNKALSYKAKGLMTFMLSVPEDWDYSLFGLSTLSSDGIDGVRSGIKELEKHGYLTRRRLRDDGGKLGDIEYTIHEIPKIPTGGEPSGSSREPPSKPNTPTLVLPTLENPTQCINKLLSNNSLSNNKPNNKKTKPVCLSAASADSEKIGQLSLDDTDCQNQQAERLTVKTARGTGKPEYHAMTLVEQLFVSFWQQYPRKAGKKAAKKAWMDIKPDEALFLTIMEALKAANQYWHVHGISLKHIPHPSTWLNEERWEDEFSAEQLSEDGSMTLDKNRKGGVRNAASGANYTIGGDDDPYRAIIQS